MSAQPGSAKVVIIGGGIIGCSTAYHLGRLGITDCLLLERKKLTSGTTFHAAGLVGQLRSSANITQLLGYSVELYDRLEAETGQATGWKRNGGLRLACNAERWVEVKRQATTAQSFGLEMTLLTAKEARDLWPLMSVDDVVGAAFLPSDGQANPSDITPAMLDRFLPLLKKVHCDIAAAFRGPALTFWPFHVLRDYGRSLEEGGSRHRGDLPALLAVAAELEAAVGDITLVFGHNDLLPGNILDDGRRLWLIDWDYAGFGSPLFDLANLATNCGLDDALERHLLRGYFDKEVDEDLYRRFSAMKCASLLRETMWSMVSEIHSTLDFDYASYTADNRARFDAARDAFLNLQGS